MSLVKRKKLLNWRHLYYKKYVNNFDIKYKSTILIMKILAIYSIIRVIISNKYEHHLCFNEKQGKKNLSSFCSFYTVHLHNGGIGMGCHVCKEIIVSSSDTAGFVYLVAALYLTGTVSDLSEKVNVPCREDVVTNIIVDCLFAAHDRVLILYAYVMDRLSFSDQRAYDHVQMRHLIFSDIDSFS
jgi:hypothetical protein